MKTQRLREATDSTDPEGKDVQAEGELRGRVFAEVARFSTLLESDGEGHVVEPTTIETIGLDAESAKRKLPRGAGAYSSGRSDVSDRAEEILRLAAAGSR